MDNAFFATLLFIFLAALVSAVATRNRRDRCLKELEGYQVTIELVDGRVIWGKLAVFSNALEVFYQSPHHDDENGHVETSFILLESQLANIQAIYRYHDELSDFNKEMRRLDIVRTHHPGLHRILARAARNFLNTFRDAVNEAIGFVISNAKASGSVVQTQDKHLMKIGETVLGTVAHAYEPVLERYIGRRVIAEEFLGETDIAEHPGILKEYTAEWLELLDCQLAKEHNFDFSRPEKLQLNRNLDFVIHKSEAIPPTFKVTLENHGSEPVKVKKVEALDYVQPVDARLVPDGELTISLSDLPPDCFEGLDFAATPAQIELRAEDRQHYLQNESHTFPVLPPINIVIEAVREGDLCLPRSRGLVRHGAEAPAPGWLRAAWISLQNGVSIYGVQAYAFISWVLFNGFISGWFIWYVTRVVFGLGITISLACGILGGLIYGGLWAMQGSMAIQGERQIAQRLRRRLGGVSVLLIIGLAIYVAMG